MAWRTPIFFCRMLHDRGVCRLGSPQSIAAVVTGGGDLIAQGILESREELDRRRLLLAVLLGAAVDGFALQRWYAWLHWRVRGQPTCDVFGRRLLLHHAVWAPLAASIFVLTTASHPQPSQKLRQELGGAVCAHWCVVGPAQIANAFLVPKPFQVLLANACALTWATVLSALAHRPLAPSAPSMRT